MATFLATDWYPNTDSHFRAYCKICPGPVSLLHTEFYRTGCGMEIAFCSNRHLHTIKHLGPDWGQIKWIPLHEFCITKTKRVRKLKLVKITSQNMSTKPQKCPGILRTETLTSFTTCPACGLVFTNSDGKHTKHPNAPGVGILGTKKHIELTSQKSGLV